MAQKRPGRPVGFDRDTVLNRAIQVFWSKGYDGASMKDLTRAMGINSPSLYSAFGDKQSLYLRCIDSYIDNGACAPLTAFEAEPEIGRAVRAFFLAAIDYSADDQEGARGCFLASSACVNATGMSAVKERLKRAIAETDARLAARFKAEVAAGCLPESFPSEARAALMFDLRQGIVFRARAGISADEISAGVEEKSCAVLA